MAALLSAFDAVCLNNSPKTRGILNSETVWVKPETTIFADLLSDKRTIIINEPVTLTVYLSEIAEETIIATLDAGGVSKQVQIEKGDVSGSSIITFDKEGFFNVSLKSIEPNLATIRINSVMIEVLIAYAQTVGGVVHKPKSAQPLDVRFTSHVQSRVTLPKVRIVRTAR